MRAQAAGLCGFSGFKSESALRLGKAGSKSLAARVAVQATTVSPETLQHAAGILQQSSDAADDSLFLMAILRLWCIVASKAWHTVFMGVGASSVTKGPAKLFPLWQLQHDPNVICYYTGLQGLKAGHPGQAAQCGHQRFRPHW